MSMRTNVRPLICSIKEFSKKFLEIKQSVSFCSIFPCEEDNGRLYDTMNETYIEGGYVKLDGDFYEIEMLREILTEATITDEPKSEKIADFMNGATITDDSERRLIESHLQNPPLVILMAMIVCDLYELEFFLYSRHTKGIEYCEPVIKKIRKLAFDICGPLEKMYHILNGTETDKEKEKLLKTYWKWDLYLKKSALLYRAIDDLQLCELAEQEQKTESQTVESRPPKEDDLTVTEQIILEALAGDTLTGEELLKRAGYDNSSHYRTILSNLRKRNIMGNDGKGYFKK